MRRTVYFIILLVVSVNCEDDGDHHSHHHRHYDCKEKECELVTQAIEDIGMYFDKQLCHAFKHVHCENHVLQHDEVVCGSDGRTYNNHCLFAQARCEVILDDHNYIGHVLAYPLRIAGYGACFQSTISTATPSISGSLTMAAITTGGGSITSTKSQTTTMILTTTKATTTTTAIPTTTMSMHNLLGSVFCQYRTSVVCSPTFSIVCGSDGKYYPNSCELLKVQCGDPLLRIQPDLSQCSLSP